MLSRRHIRVKVMQALYMFYNEGMDRSSIPQLKRQLKRNITSLYELYLYQLAFLSELGHFVQDYQEGLQSRYIQNERDLSSAARLLDNPILQKLMKSEALSAAMGKYGVTWQGDEDMMRRVYLDLKNQDAFREYAQLAEQNPILNQEVLLFVLKHYPQNFSALQGHFEEQFYNWHDDRKVAQSMAQKSIRTLASEPDADSFLQPMSPNDDELFDFAESLLETTIASEERIDKLLIERLEKWEPHQVARVDHVILRMAVNEFLNFPAIPAKVTINEYIELAKNYSTPQSKNFVNGVLDAVLQYLRKEGTPQTR